MICFKDWFEKVTQCHREASFLKAAWLPGRTTNPKILIVFTVVVCRLFTFLLMSPWPNADKIHSRKGLVWYV